ncbi:type I-F CRISPR-associated protein Csy1 [Pseudothauera rhizosphaerae]|uniref:Type I-F CRISPR-associated protein Csy1 n=1 Tax=Pseudothauera rhizosphaerae TaxID=2565932 RepID=A0A4S4AJD8_9RHOO|nr:type I-F CRISPR-associated protein Csy1 [Pseudothauera rhizosphaerae]THF59403.1 type I-F CRISPR-associated protein Csy1 [Pseudothauera rhizosphaerae]
MNEETESGARSNRFRTTIAAFIEARREAKLKGKDDDAGAASKYEYATWLADAARRVGQIQAVTHVLKATHPDARGSSLHVDPATLPRHREIGSHLLGEDYAEDVVGNAAALDVFKFLKLDVDGKRLLDWMQAGDADLMAALSPDSKLAKAWMEAFASLVREGAKPATHPMAKQVYWLVGEEPQDDSQYHLLQPMFSSSLAHAVHADIQDARFGDANKEARQAFRDKRPSDAPYRDYRNLVARKLGGTKPQNISQLNSERGGINYLLPSLPPPAWQADGRSSVSKRESVLEVFLWFEDVRRLTRALSDYLLSVQDKTGNKDIRDARDDLIKKIAEQLALFGVAIRGRYPAGWTRDGDCRLTRCERLWLDPERTELPLRDDPEHPEWKAGDEAFNAEYDHGDWADEVATRFGLWLNAQIRKAGLVTMALPELNHWVSHAIVDVAWPTPLRRRAKVEEIA